MTFPFSLYLVAFLAAAAVSGASLPLWLRWCHRSGHVDDPGHRKIHDRPVPLAGGLAVLTGLALPITLAALLFGVGLGFLPSLLDPIASQLAAYGLQRRALPLAAALAGAVGMLAIGWWDDRRELRPSSKLILQAVVAGLVAAAGIRVTLFVPLPWFGWAVTVLWILTVTNACNFMDNMNGLCTGLGFVASWCFSWSAACQGQFLVATLAFLTAGALLGFLPFNYPEARSFLGDAGSHLVGFLLAVLAILPDFYSVHSPHPLNVLKPLLILGVVLGDLAMVVWIRWRAGRPVYVGDNNHLSHRLARRGLSRARVVALLWLAATLLGGLSFLL